MDDNQNNENNQNNEQPQDLNVSMQKSSALLKKVMNKTGKTVKSATTIKEDIARKGAKLKALKRKAEGSAKIAKGSAKATAGGAAIGAGAATRAIGLGLKAAATAANIIPVAGQAISATLNAAATPVMEAGKKAMEKGANLAKSGAKSIANGTKDMQVAEQIENGGPDPGSSNGGNEGSSGMPKIPKPKIPNKLKIIKGLMLKAVKTKAFKIGVVVLVCVLILIVIVDIIHEGEVDDGKYIEGDESNVPYVVDSQIMSSITIVNDGSGGFMYAFTDAEGNIIDLDTAIDNALQTLKDNDCTALLDMGKNDKEQKALLKKLVQAEMATQYPDLSDGEDLGHDATTNRSSSGTDYYVDLSNSNSIPECTQAQLTQIIKNSSATEEGKNNMLSVVPDLIRLQKEYNVNAVFFMAVALKESTWGTDWVIDSSTYNWCSVKGSENGGYIDSEGTSWNKYSSFADSTQAWFELISGESCFGARKTSVYEIGVAVYDDANWNQEVSDIIRTLYSSIDINITTYENSTGIASTGTATGNISSDLILDEDEKVNGGVKIQRKSESGSVVNLKYTSTQNFNALIEANDVSALNYYTLIKNVSTESNGSSITIQGSDYEKQIWNYLIESGCTEAGTAGLMGNLECESGLYSICVQGKYPWASEEDKEYCEEYVRKVDSGEISKNDFVYNGPNGGGFGLAQWTDNGRKGELYEYVKDKRYIDWRFANTIRVFGKRDE